MPTEPLILMPEVLILGILGLLVGGIVGFYWLRTRTLTSSYKDAIIEDLKETVKAMTDQLKEAKSQRQQLYGKIGNLKKGQTVSIETDPGEDPKASIMEMIDSIKDQVDPRFQKLLNNPRAMDFIVNMGMGMHKKYPKEVESFIAKFLPNVATGTKGLLGAATPAPELSRL